jgi:dTDP-4-dehydrorhamnose 3,5-epimerase
MNDTESPIVGVVQKPLKTHRDARGFFREVVRFNDPFFDGFGRERNFAQWSHSFMVKDVVKAWHYHHVQFDWWYISAGQVETVLFDNRPESPTYRQKMVFRMGDAAQFGPDTLEVCVKIPPGVLHGLRVLSTDAHLFYITSETYNPQEEGRIAFDSPEVPHSWGSGALVVDNDKRNFVPTSTRVLLNK